MNTSVEPVASAAVDRAALGGAYRWYVVAVLSFAQLVSFLDRTILSLLMVPIKADLGLSDAELGVLVGLGFAIFYSVLGIPIGRMVDLVNRRALIIAGVTLWTAMTALSGFARSFGTLLLARVGLGAGEAVLNPAGISIIADYFPRQQLGRALGIFGLGVYVGNGLALLGGGAILSVVMTAAVGSKFAPWQLAFFAASIPGLFALCLLLTVKEPIRPATARNRRVPMREVFDLLVQQRRGFVVQIGGMIAAAIVANGVSAWVPSLLVRKFGYSLAEAGLAFGAITLVAGTLGVFIGGALVDRLATKRCDAPSLVLAGAFAATCIPGIAFPLLDERASALAALAVFYFFATMLISSSMVGLQWLIPHALRGLLTAMLLGLVTLLGNGFGPLIVGLLSEHGFSGPQSLSHSLAVVVGATAPLAALCTFLGRNGFRRGVEHARTFATDAPID